MPARSVPVLLRPCQLLQLGLQTLPEPALHERTEVLDKVAIGMPDRAHAIAHAAHQAGALQLSELTVDRRLRKTGGGDQ